LVENELIASYCKFEVIDLLKLKSSYSVCYAITSVSWKLKGISNFEGARLSWLLRFVCWEDTWGGVNKKSKSKKSSNAFTCYSEGHLTCFTFLLFYFSSCWSQWRNYHTAKARNAGGPVTKGGPGAQAAASPTPHVNLIRRKF